MGWKPKPEAVQRVLDALSEDEIKQIQKENPFRNERNDKIRELLKRGVTTSIIEEISGFSDTTIARIKRREYKIRGYALDSSRYNM